MAAEARDTMAITEAQRQAADNKFAEEWKGKGYEKGQLQPE